MAKRKTVKRRSNRAAMIGISVMVAVILCVLFIQGSRLQVKAEVYAAREAELSEEIEKERERTQEIEDQKKYMQTDKYVEEVARQKLGLVYPNETIYKSDK